MAFTALNAPVKLDGVSVHKDIVFDQEHNLALDVYRNEKITKPQPVLVFFYGGSWREGKKEQYKFISSKFSEAEFITVIPDYRKYPDVLFPDFIEDGAKALAWVKNNIADFHGDASQIFIAGHSAGAHIASLLIADEKYLKPYDMHPDKDLAGFIGISGGYDFIPEKEFRKVVFANEVGNNYQDISAAHFISGDEPPILLLHGEKDDVVTIQQSHKFEDKIKSKGGKVILKTYKNADHLNIMSSLTWLGSEDVPIFTDMREFMQSQL